MKSKGFFKVKIWTYAIITDTRTGKKTIYKWTQHDSYKTFAKKKDAKKYANSLKHGDLFDEWCNDVIDDNGEWYCEYCEKRIDKTEIEEIW